MRLQLYVALSFSLALSLPFSVSLSPCYAVVLHLLLASGKEARANPSAITAATATGSCTLNLTPFANLSPSLGQKLTHRAHTHTDTDTDTFTDTDLLAELQLTFAK